jgi:methylated-DNA-protein-cysteine methyltransferase-like protein
MEKDFFEMVYQVVRLIPQGRVTSYGAIAKYLGSAKSSRIVGYAMNGSHQQKILVPAQRVIEMVCLQVKFILQHQPQCKNCWSKKELK